MNKNTKIPNSWKWVTLNDISVTSSGGTPNRKNSSYYNGNIPWVKSGELNYNTITDTDEHISEEALSFSSAKIFPKGSLLIALYGNTVGRMAFLGVDATTNQAVASITPFLINPKYLFYYLMASKEDLLNKREGSAQANISQKVLNEFPFPLAPIEEQNRIVDKVEENMGNISESIFEITEQIRLIPAYKQLNIDKLIKEEGTKISLSNVANFIDYRGKTPRKTKSGIRLITAKNVKKGFISFEPEEFISTDDYNDWMSRGIPEKGDVFITTEAPLGNIAEYDFDEKIALAQRIITIQPNPELNGTYLKYYLMSSKFQKALILKSTGTTVNGIKSRTLKKMDIYYPEIKEQLIIINELNRINSFADKLKEELLESLNKIGSLKNKILQDAFKGKLSHQYKSDSSVELLLLEISKLKLEYIKNQVEIKKNKPKYIKMAKEKLSIIEVLKKHNEPVNAENLWQESEHEKIDDFYEKLKEVEHLVIQDISKIPVKISLK